MLDTYIYTQFGRKHVLSFHKTTGISGAKMNEQSRLKVKICREKIFFGRNCRENLDNVGVLPSAVLTVNIRSHVLINMFVDQGVIEVPSKLRPTIDRCLLLLDGYHCLQLTTTTATATAPIPLLRSHYSNNSVFIYSILFSCSTYKWLPYPITASFSSRTLSSFSLCLPSYWRIMVIILRGLIMNSRN